MDVIFTKILLILCIITIISAYTNDIYFMRITVFILYIYGFLYIYTHFIYENLINTKYFNDDVNYQYINDINNKNDDCPFYNCDKQKSDYMIAIGSDKNNISYLKLNDNYYRVDNDNIIIPINEIDKDNIIYFDLPIKVPVDLSKMKLNINMQFNGYKFIGFANNNYYYQNYLVYEQEFNDLNPDFETKLYKYILVKIINNQYKIMYELPPRNKILPSEYFWVSYGSYQIGPLIFN